MKTVKYVLALNLCILGCADVGLYADPQPPAQRGETQWMLNGNAAIYSKSGKREVQQKTNSFKWINGKGEAQDIACKAIVIQPEGIVWCGRAFYDHFAITKNGFIAVKTLSGGDLFVHTSIEKLGREEDSSSKLNIALQNCKKNIATDPLFYERRIELRKILGALAFVPAGDTQPQPPPAITDIEVRDSGLVLKLKGVNNGAVAEVTFDEEMKPLLAILNGKKVFESQ